MKPLLITTAIIVSLFPGIDFAHGHDDKEHDLDTSQFVNLQFENDLFGSGEDSHFTHGTRISYLTREQPTGFEGKLKSTVLAVIPKFLIPKTRKNFITLNIGAVLIYASVYVEKGIALIIPGFTPDVLGQIYVYTPSMTEIRTAVMIFSLGSLLFTFLVKVTIAIVFEEYNIDVLNKKKRVGKLLV